MTVRNVDRGKHAQVPDAALLGCRESWPMDVEESGGGRVRRRRERSEKAKKDGFEHQDAGRWADRAGQGRAGQDPKAPCSLCLLRARLTDWGNCASRPPSPGY